jgi:hypothetical protein
MRQATVASIVLVTFALLLLGVEQRGYEAAADTKVAAHAGSGSAAKATLDAAPAPVLDAHPAVLDAAPVALQDAATAAPATVSAAPPAKATEDPLGSLAALVRAIKTGDYRMAAALALALVMVALSKVRDKTKLFAGDRGGAILAAILGFAGALSTAIAAGAPIDLKLFTAAVQVTFIAVGGYTWIKRLWKPSTPPKAPAPAPAPPAAA